MSTTKGKSTICKNFTFFIERLSEKKKRYFAYFTFACIGGRLLIKGLVCATFEP